MHAKHIHFACPPAIFHVQYIIYNPYKASLPGFLLVQKNPESNLKHSTELEEENGIFDQTAAAEEVRFLQTEPLS